MRFYVWQRGRDPVPACAGESHPFEIWRPSLTSLKPRGLPLLPYGVWWLFHQSRFFANREYGLVLLREGGELVHSSLVTPGYFRFPEMARSDVQIGATYTHPAWRGRGIAKAAIAKVCEVWQARCNRIWYITETANTPSVRVVESCGFALTGEGARVRRSAAGLLAQYRITRTVTPRA